MITSTSFKKDGHIVQVAWRTFTLSLALSLLPPLIPALAKSQGSSDKVRKLLARELGPTSFAFSMTLAVAGGRVLDNFFKKNSIPYKNQRSFTAENHRTFLANTISSTVAVILFTSRNKRPPRSTSTIPFTLSIPRNTSPTLDLTLLILVRALDARVQAYLQNHLPDTSESVSEKAKSRKALTCELITKYMDVVLFWLACSRIMWCFFYKPGQLPRSYVKWIKSLANMDTRLIEALQAIYKGTWKYGQPALDKDVRLEDMAMELNMDPCLGNPLHLPAYGGPLADQVWQKFNVHGRQGVGGLPCNIVHCGTAGNSCTGNAMIRFGQAFTRAFLIYAPVHVLPGLLARPRQSIRQPLPTLLAILRSATFLSTFISSFWYTVCLTRSVALARIFPKISHNAYDGPYGCVLAGSLICGFSIAIEKQKRRGEIALYVLPRAIRACLPERWTSSHSRIAQTFERLILVLSLASILTSAVHYPKSLRGMSKWTLNYVMSEHSQRDGTRSHYQGQGDKDKKLY